MLVLPREVASGAYGVERAAAAVWAGDQMRDGGGFFAGWDEFDQSGRACSANCFCAEVLA